MAKSDEEKALAKAAGGPVTTPPDQVANKDELLASAALAAPAPAKKVKRVYEDPRMEPDTTYTGSVTGGNAREVDVTTDGTGKVTTDDPDEQSVLDSWGFSSKEA